MEAGILEAVRVMKNGGVILYPTDTIWGIGCDATNSTAVRRVFEIKRRSEAKSLVLLAADLDMVARYVKQIPPIAIDLVEVNDAPMTIIYPGAQGIAPEAVAQDGSVGIRIPFASRFCIELCRRLNRPVVSTSANISGEPSAKTFEDISPQIKSAVDFIADPSLGNGGSGKASQIIKVALNGEVQIIRG